MLNIPKLTPEDVNEARRFILFIDELYESKAALIIESEAKITKIYEKGAGKEAFLRTISRLNEIRSDFYWKNSKINKNI